MTQRKPVKPIYKGKIIEVNIETVALPHGGSCELEIVHHPGGAAAVALDAEDKVCLLRQYRHAAGGWIWELPAGKLDPGEEPLLTAQRELREEAGLGAGRWESLGSMISSPGVFTEVIHLYLARDLSYGTHNTEEHECIEVHWLPFAQALEWAESGEIRDAKSIIGLFRARRLVQG